MTLNIPIHQTITLPDDWQACKTPQELNYWLIAKFQGFQANFDSLNASMSNLQTQLNTQSQRIDTVETRTIDTEGDLLNLENQRYLASAVIDFDDLTSGGIEYAVLYIQWISNNSGIHSTMNDLFLDILNSGADNSGTVPVARSSVATTSITASGYFRTVVPEVYSIIGANLVNNGTSNRAWRLSYDTNNQVDIPLANNGSFVMSKASLLNVGS